MSRLICSLFTVFMLVASPLLGVAKADEAPLTLDQALKMALANNPAVLKAAADLAATEQSAKAARADRLPKLSTSYSYATLADSPYANFNGNKVVVGSRDQFNWDLKLTQPLFTGFALSAKTRLAELGVSISEVDQQLAVLDLTAQVRLTYYEILRKKQLLKVAEETVTQLTAHLKDAQNFFDQGLIPLNDLLKSKVALSNADQIRLQAESDLELAVSQLNLLLRLPLEQPTAIVDQTPDPEPLPELAPLFEEALSNRPEPRTLQLALDKNDQQLRLAKSSYYPEVDLEGRYSRTGDDPAASNNDYANDHNESLGVKATWTFFEWGRTRAQVRSQIHARDSLAAQVEETMDTVRLQVRQNWLQLKVARASIKTAEEAQIQAEENFRLTRLQYQQALATSSDVLDARALLSQAEANTYNSIYGYLSARAQLERAVGRDLGTGNNSATQDNPAAAGTAPSTAPATPAN